MKNLSQEEKKVIIEQIEEVRKSVEELKWEIVFNDLETHPRPKETYIDDPCWRLNEIWKLLA